MNKKLVAVAIAGLLAAPLAQAQTANVTLYGRINIDMEFVSGRLSNNTNPNVYRVTSNSSRFGLRGTESLGGGLNAIFQIENGSIRPTTGDGGNLAGRDSFVGLSGGWGTFKMGRYLAPYDDIHGIFGNDNTASTSILSTAALWAQGFAGQPVNGGFDDRLQQSIRYDIADAGRASTSRRNSRRKAARAARPARPRRRATATTSRTARSTETARSSAASLTNTTTTSAARRTLPLSDSAFSVAAKWQFSQFNIAGVYEKMEYEVANGLTALTQVRNKLKRNSFWAIDTHDQRRRQRAGLPVLGQGVGRHRQRDRHAGSRSSPRTPSSTSQHLARRRPGQGRQHGRHPVGSQLLVRPVEAHADLHGLREDQQRFERELQLQHQSVPRQRRHRCRWAGRHEVSGFVMGMYHNF